MNAEELADAMRKLRDFVSTIGSRQGVDERALFFQKTCDAPPLAHEHLQLRERADGLLAGQVDHAGAARTNGFDLGPVVLDVAIPCDEQFYPTA